MQNQREAGKLIQVAMLLAACLWTRSALAATPASSALGQLTVEGKTIPLNHAYAVSGPDTFDGTKEAFMVLLTENPLAPDAIRQADSFDELGEKGIRSLLDSGLLLKIGADKGYHVTIRHPALKGSELQKSGFSGLRIATLGPDRVSATFASSSGMGKSEGDGGLEEIVPNRAVRFKVTFDAPVARRFPLDEKLEVGTNATKLPIGGGEPGKAWVEKECKPAPALPDFKDLKAVEKYLFAQGMTEKDVQEEMARASKREGRRVTRDEALKGMAEFMKGMAELGNAMRTTDCKVLGGAQGGKIAIIQVEATMGGGRVATDVTLVKEGGGWVVKKTGAWRSP